MRNWLYAIYAVAMAALSIYTGEIVTFIMLGFILISLQNIHAIFKEKIRLDRDNNDKLTEIIEQLHREKD